MSLFDESLLSMDPEALRSSIDQMKADVKREVNDEFYSKEEGELIIAAIDNLSEELKGLTSFKNIKISHKARIIAFMSFIYDVLDSEGDYDDDDEDFDDEDDADDDEEEFGNNDQSQPKDKKISFPK